MTEKRPKTWIKLQGLSLHRTILNGRFTSLESYKTSIFKLVRWIFSPKAIHGQWIHLTHGESHFLYSAVRGVLCDLINVLGYFSVILRP